MPLTPREKQIERINQLQAKLARAQNRLDTADRKQRNSELIVWGVYIEEFYRHADSEGRSRLEESIKHYLTGRNLTRAMRGLERVRGEKKSIPNAESIAAMNEQNLPGYDSVQAVMDALHE